MSTSQIACRPSKLNAAASRLSQVPHLYRRMATKLLTRFPSILIESPTPSKCCGPKSSKSSKCCGPKSPALRMYSIQSEFVSRLATLIHDNPYRPPRTRSSHITVCVARIGISMSLMSSIGLVLVGNSHTWTSQLGTGLVLLAVPAFLVCSAALLTGRKKKLSLCGMAIAFIVVCYYPTIFAIAR